MTLRVALYGRSGSGKSTVARLLVDSLGAEHLKTGEACRRLCLDLFNRQDKTILNEVTDALRAIDESVWTRAAMRSFSGTGSAVLDSMRFSQDLELARAHGFATVRVHAPRDVRMQRLAARGQAFDPTVDDLHPAELELEDRTFDFEVVNDGTLEQLAAQVRELERSQ